MNNLFRCKIQFSPKSQIFYILFHLPFFSSPNLPISSSSLSSSLGFTSQNKITTFHLRFNLFFCRDLWFGNSWGVFENLGFVFVNLPFSLVLSTLHSLNPRVYAQKIFASYAILQSRHRCLFCFTSIYRSRKCHRWELRRVYWSSLYVTVPIGLMYFFANNTQNIQKFMGARQYVVYPPEGPRPPSPEEIREMARELARKRDNIR